VSRLDGCDEAEEGDNSLGERPEGALAWRGKRVRRVQRAGALEPSAALGVLVVMVGRSEGMTGVLARSVGPWAGDGGVRNHCGLS
jgi:hypothetical protein